MQWGDITANVGDSSAVLVHREDITPLSRAHTPMDPEEKKRIEAAGGIVRGDRVFAGRGGIYLRVSRSLGDSAFAPEVLVHTPEVSLVEVAHGDATLLAFSDGLIGEVTSSDVAQIVSGSDNNLASSLCKKAFEHGARDDTTVVAVKLSEVSLEDGELLAVLVADGHGGSQVSTYLRDHFLAVLKDKILDVAKVQEAIHEQIFATIQASVIAQAFNSLGGSLQRLLDHLERKMVARIKEELLEARKRNASNQSLDNVITQVYQEFSSIIFAMENLVVAVNAGNEDEISAAIQAFSTCCAMPFDWGTAGKKLIGILIYLASAYTAGPLVKGVGIFDEQGILPGAISSALALCVGWLCKRCCPSSYFGFFSAPGPTEEEGLVEAVVSSVGAGGTPSFT